MGSFVGIPATHARAKYGYNDMWGIFKIKNDLKPLKYNITKITRQVQLAL